MQKAQTGDMVKVHYKGTLDNGDMFDSSEGKDPLQFEIGSGNVIPGFDNGVMDMAIGEKKSITLPPEMAYGERQENLVAKIERSRLPEELKPEVGQQLLVQRGDGMKFPARVVEFNDDSVTIDANAPLAGKTLHFELEMVEIQTPEG